MDDSYTEMTSFENEDGEKIYTAEISTEATTASIGRMLPSGKYCNEIVITVNSGSSKTVDITSGFYDGIGYYLTSFGSEASVGTYVYGE